MSDFNTEELAMLHTVVKGTVDGMKEMRDLFVKHANINNFDNDMYLKLIIIEEKLLKLLAVN